MAFDGLVTKSIVTELNSILIGGKINKVFQPTKNELVIDIYSKEKFFLDICIDSSNCRINLTNHLKPNPKAAPNFCMLLRKYLNGSRITSIQTVNLDRIVIINLKGYNGLDNLVNYSLIIELMGKHSNVILTNENNIIIDSMRHISCSNDALRNILPANPYILPTSSKLDLQVTSEDNFLNSISSSDYNLVTAITNCFVGMSSSFLNYTLEKLDIDSNNFTKNDLIKFYSYFEKLLESITNFKVKCEEFELNGKKDFALTLCDKASLGSINEFVDNYYAQKESYETFVNYKNSVLKLILSLLNKYNKKLIVIQEKLNECNDMEQYKLYGELIIANLYKINNNINIENIELENYYDNNKKIVIPLDKKISPSLNAKKYFKKYNKLKNTLNIVNEQKSEIKKEINYLESIVYAIENSTSSQEISEIHQEIEENILKITKTKSTSSKKNNLEIAPLKIDGFVVYVGKNNTQNDIITFKMSDRNDLWFHVQGFHGSHVLLKTNGATIDDTNPILIKCAKLAALHSKASGEKKVLVDYTLVKNLKKPKGSKPGFVVFNQYKTIIIENN